MKVILLDTVPDLGRRGATVDVKTGYARNFLFPVNRAVEATPGNLRHFESLQKRFVQEEAVRVGALREMSDKLGAVSLTIEMKSSGDGHLYGSVNSSSIKAALATEGFEVEERAIRLDQPIKAVGVYPVPVHLHSDIQTQIKVWVVEENAEPEQKENEEESASTEEGDENSES